jgi:SNF2 family DNA or RNA helicase
VVREELERAERHWRNACAAPRASAELHVLRRQLYPYQKEGVERFFVTGRLLLADDMGLGKTTQAIAACHALFAAGRVARGLVIAPASLKAQWLREWQETTSTPAAVVDGTADERARQYRELRRGFLILHYEQLLRDAEAVHALRPDMVVLDEAQRIKNYATKSAEYVKALSPEYRLVLTGTPMENRLEELASILDWVDDVALAPKWRLAAWYTQWDGDGRGKTGARNLDTLRARLAPCVLRRARTEVAAQLPPRTDTRVPVEMTPQQTAEHDDLAAPIVRIVQASKKRPITQAEFLRLMSLLTRQRIIANGLGQLRFEELWPAYGRARPDAMLLEGLFAPKLLELRRLVSDLAVAQRRKIVVFSQWRRLLRLAEWSLRDVLGNQGLRAVFFTGGERPAQRTKSIIDFHDDPRVAVMLLTDAGGVGLNLQKAASACINFELPWNPAVLEQRIGRIYRMGQKRPIDVYNLVCEGSIESRIAGLVGAKQALFSGLFDGTTDEVRFEAASSFLTRVERLVEPGPRSEPRQRVPAELTDHDSEIPSTLPEAGLLDAALADTDPAPAPAVADAREDSLEANEPEGERVNRTGDASPGGSQRDGQGPARSSGAHEEVPTSVSSLFERLRVERTESGGIRIEAPPEAAASLVALFDGMAKLLSASVR